MEIFQIKTINKVLTVNIPFQGQNQSGGAGSGGGDKKGDKVIF